MKYTFPVIAKAVMATVTAALGAAAVAAGGPDLSVLTIGDILGALGAGLVAGGATFGTPNKDTETPTEKVSKGVEAAVAAQAAANAEVEAVKKALETAVTGAVPALGPLASQILSGTEDIWRRP